MDWRGRWPHCEYPTFHSPEIGPLRVCFWGASAPSLSSPSSSAMATKMKGFFKGFKYISQIFVYKEHEMEIGYPTDVRHVAHIGWDSSAMNAPSWMNEFKTTSDFSSTSLSSFGQSRDTSWASQDFEQGRGGPRAPTMAGVTVTTPHTPADIPKAPKKMKRKKAKLLSPRSSRSSSRASFATALGEETDFAGKSG